VPSRAASTLSWHSGMNVAFATAWFTYTIDQQQIKAPTPRLQATRLMDFSPTIVLGASLH
jgi:hypothetical protein